MLDWPLSLYQTFIYFNLTLGSYRYFKIWEMSFGRRARINQIALNLYVTKESLCIFFFWSLNICHSSFFILKLEILIEGGMRDECCCRFCKNDITDTELKIFLLERIFFLTSWCGGFQLDVFIWWCDWVTDQLKD